MDAAPGCWGGTLARMPAAASVNMDREYAHVQVECGPQNDYIAVVMTINARVHRSIESAVSEYAMLLRRSASSSGTSPRRIS